MVKQGASHNTNQRATKFNAVTNTDIENRVLIIGGPTASGKSRAAIGLAREHDGVVINADAMQVYRDLEILTARPNREDLTAAPHALYGVLDGAERCSVARWRNLAITEIGRALGRGLRPIVVGGTGLYLRSLVHGLAPVPRVSSEITDRVAADYDRLGADAFHEVLGGRDPEMAARLNPGDRQRNVRALAVLEATGKSLAAWHRVPVQPAPYRFDVRILMPDRTQVYEACDLRFAAMFENGAVDEVAALAARRLDPGLPVMKSLGVAEISAYIDGRLSRDDAVASGARATRRYAKRQMTWFRHQMVGATMASNYQEIEFDEI
jgi:tRNA dimethylallyltransferase